MPEFEREFYLPRAAAEHLPADMCEPFTKVVAIEVLTHPWRPRFSAIDMTTLDEAIFMDGDTLFVSPVPELFDTLKTFDVGVAAAPQYLHRKAVQAGIYELLPTVPVTIPEWNTGVLVVRMTEEFRAFSREWSQWFGLCRERGYGMDQAAFRGVLANSRLRVATIAQNYNFRAGVPQYVFGNVRIIHAHGQLQEIAKTINQQTGYRLYQPNLALIDGKKPKDLEIFKKIAKRS